MGLGAYRPPNQNFVSAPLGERICPVPDRVGNSEPNPRARVETSDSAISLTLETFTINRYTKHQTKSCVVFRRNHITAVPGSQSLINPHFTVITDVSACFPLIMVSIHGRADWHRFMVETPSRPSPCHGGLQWVVTSRRVTSGPIGLHNRNVPPTAGLARVCLVMRGYRAFTVYGSEHGHRILGKTEMALQHRANGQQFAS